MNQASIDLVLASFDLLVLQANRGDSEDHAYAARSFIVNKLPLLLSSVSLVAIVPLNVPLVVQEALGRVENTVPQRTAFLTASVLHHLITEDDVERITGIRVPAHHGLAPASHANLLQQYKANSQMIDKFIAALESLDGNAAAYAETIVDVRTVSPHRIPITDTI
jgi:mediator of RNA polymerase II transcription subunit 5